tara:strand:- start:177 stop:1313 length:1137 start_codon:yes stop_codon:yes gene_type:complete
MSEIKVNSIKGVGASTAAITVDNTAGTCTANITNNLSNRSFIINGAFQINQRGSVTMGSSSAYTLDRWRAACGSSFNWDSAVVSQSTTSPDGFSNSLKVDIANTETPTAGQNALVQQKIEAQNLQSLAFGTSNAEQCTLSFHVRSNKTGTYCVQVTQADASKYVLFEYSISSADTWEKKTITISGNTADVIANDNGGGFEVNWHLACHSDDHVAATTSWASSGGFKATSNQVNLFDNASNEWYLAGVQLEVGSVATDFEHRSYGQELALCQRYYFKFLEGNNKEIGAAWYYTASHASFFFRFPVPMRAVPTGTDTTGTNYYTIYRNGGSDGLDSVAFENGSTEQFSAFNSSEASGTAGQCGLIRATNASAKIEFSAEI